MLKILFLIISLLTASLNQAQEHYVFSLIDSNDGLSEDRIRSITQLPDGRMVILTDGLINLYNGTSFQYLHINDYDVYPLAGYHGYYHTYISNQGQFWVKDYKRLLLFDIKEERFVSNLDSVLAIHEIHAPLSDFFMDSQSNLWYLTQDDNLIFRNVTKGETQTFISNISHLTDDDDRLLDMTVYEDRVFMFYKSGLMICFDLITGKELFRENPFGSEKVSVSDQVIFIVPHKQYLYQVRNGDSGYLLRYDIKKRLWETVLKQDYWLNTISLDSEGNIWLSSSQGLWFIDKNLRKKQRIPELKLVDGREFKTAINAQFNDKQGGLWIGTSKRGLLYYHPDRFKFKNIGRPLFDIPDDLDFRVNCFMENGSEILVGTSIGLFSYSDADQRLTRYDKIPGVMPCFMMLKDKDNRIWLIAWENGLYCIEGEAVKQYTFKEGDAYYFYENTDGSYYISLGQGFGLFDPKTGSYKQIKSTRQLGVIYQMVECGQNTLLGISNAGLFTYDRKTDSLHITGTYEKERAPMFRQSNYRYDCLYSDSQGLIWLGTRDGLSIWDPHKEALTNLSMKDGLINNRIQSIIEDHENNIWVSTTGGISRISIDRGKENPAYAFSNFNKYDGVIANELFERSVYCSSDGVLLWGGIDGFNETNPQNINESQSKLPKPIFTKLLVSGMEIKQGELYDGVVIMPQSIATTQELNLKYNRNFISVEFSALNFVNPAQTLYRYQLEGVDEHLQEIDAAGGIGRINYTDLSPGTYLLKISAGNNSREWSSEFAEMKIIISPPFWKTPVAYIVYIVLFFIAFYSFTSYYLRWKKRNMVRLQKEDMDKLKFRFFTNVSHELRTPLTLILTPLSALLKKQEEGQLKRQLEGIYKNADELLRIVNQLLDFRKLETTGETLRLSNCNINEFVNVIYSSFEPLMRSKEITFVRECEVSEFYAYVDKDKLQKIIYNLISNAYKFTPSGGSITLILSKCIIPEKDTEVFSIRIIDTGEGISEKELPNIFNRFYQVETEDNRYVGSGIGLHLAQEYAQLHGGFIKAESKLNEGSIFTVLIPTNLQPVNRLKPDINLESEDRDSLKVLIVEDNDEFRAFLSEQLSEQYTIITASNGSEGLKEAKEVLPDLIISDIMMPQMDGIELCKHLKKDVETSHIPVILLTARSSDESQIEGYESGADAYISKPFNPDILYLRIQNLLEQQKQRKELFKKAIIIQPESVTTTTIDERLIKQAIGCVEKNLNNPKYSVEQLSKDMNMDRTGLYRKLVAIVGQNPTVFIRSIRLKKSVQYLKEGKSVSEVSDFVGFGTASYFGKCFQEEFGVKPSEYVEVSREKDDFSHTS